jgi:hypothetical protein
MLRVLIHSGDDFDFDEGVLGEAGDFDGGAGRCDGAFGRKVLSVDGVHGGKVVHVLKKDDGFYDVGEVGSRGREDGLDVFEDTGGLIGDGSGDELAGGGIEGRRTA